MTSEDGWGDINYEKDGGSNACDALNAAMDEAADLVSAGKMTGPELKMIWDYVDEKLLAGLQRDDIVRRIKKPIQRKMLLSLGNLLKESPGKCSEITKSCVEKSPDVRSAGGSVTAAVTISPISIVSIANDLQDTTEETEWSQFGDEHERDRVLSHMKREVWNTEMKVKTESAKDLSKELTAKTAQKFFTKFNIFLC